MRVLQYPKNYPLDFTGKKLADYALTHHYHSFYVAPDYQEVLLYYYYTVRHEAYIVESGQAGKELNPQGNYDALVLDKINKALRDLIKMAEKETITFNKTKGHEL